MNNTYWTDKKGKKGIQKGSLRIDVKSNELILNP